MVTSCLPADLEAGHATYAAAGFAPLLVAGDLVEDAFCRALVDAAVAAHGRIDFLVNNAFSFLTKGLDGGWLGS